MTSRKSGGDDIEDARFWAECGRVFESAINLSNIRVLPSRKQTTNTLHNRIGEFHRWVDGSRRAYYCCACKTEVSSPLGNIVIAEVAEMKYCFDDNSAGENREYVIKH
jgi:hypothetical protein